MKRSLILSLGVFSLTPLSFALDFTKTNFSLSVGNRVVSIGDSTGSSLNLMGENKGSGALGTSVTLAHSTPTAILAAETFFPYGKNKDHIIKLAFEAQVANPEKHKVFDGISKTAKLDYRSLTSRTGVGEGAVPYAVGKFGIYSISGGSREVTVEHKLAIGTKALYMFEGEEENHNIGVGLGLLWTHDDYKYTADITPVTGSISADEAAATVPSFPNAFSMADEIESSPGNYSQNDIVTGVYTPATSISTHYSTLFWYGMAAEGSFNIRQDMLFKSGLSYYVREFKTSSNALSAAPFVAKDTDASMYIAHIGLTYIRNA